MPPEIPDYILRPKSEAQTVKGRRVEAVIIDEAHITSTSILSKLRQGLLKDVKARTPKTLDKT